MLLQYFFVKKSALIFPYLTRTNCVIALCIHSLMTEQSLLVRVFYFGGDSSDECVNCDTCGLLRFLKIYSVFIDIFMSLI